MTASQTKWNATVTELADGSALKFELFENSDPLSVGDVLAAWRHQPEFSHFFASTLAQIPFSAFKWETPVCRQDNLDQPCECVVLDTPGLSRRPEPGVFRDYFAKGTCDTVIACRNLGGDAVLVVPRQLTAADNYGHLAAFSLHAPPEQQISLWREVAEQVSLWLNTGKPLWLSTAGEGVSWLHVRLDTVPKYYGYQPYRLGRPNAVETAR